MTAAIAEDRWQEAQHAEAGFWEGATLGVLLRVCGDLHAQMDKLPGERHRALFSGKRVLEIGCGPLGLALPCFSAAAGEIADLVKLDPLPRLNLDSLPAAQDPQAEPFLSWVAARAGLGRYLQASGEAFAERASFDTVVSHNVLDHVRDPGAILDNAYAALKPGGSLLLWVDCMSL
ncbi:MAG: methyltransferase domain-containing protein, partial [Rhodovibrionaceae bacterium]